MTTPPPTPFGGYNIVYQNQTRYPATTVININNLNINIMQHPLDVAGLQLDKEGLAILTGLGDGGGAGTACPSLSRCSPARSQNPRKSKTQNQDYGR